MLDPREFYEVLVEQSQLGIIHKEIYKDLIEKYQKYLEVSNSVCEELKKLTEVGYLKWDIVKHTEKDVYLWVDMFLKHRLKICENVNVSVYKTITPKESDGFCTILIFYSDNRKSETYFVNYPIEAETIPFKPDYSLGLLFATRVLLSKEIRIPNFATPIRTEKEDIKNKCNKNRIVDSFQDEYLDSQVEEAIMEYKRYKELDNEY